MEDISREDPDYKLWLRLHQTRYAICRARAKELSVFGLTPVQAEVLFIVQAIGTGATPTEISRWIFREPHSVSRLVRQMEKAGLVRRSKDLGRKNMVRVSITEKGRQAYTHCIKRESIHNIMSVLSKAESQQLNLYLEKLLNKALATLGKEWLPFP